MATVNYSWTLPTVGASVNTWGTLLNTIIDDIDTKMVSKTATQTLTNKTLTAPTFTGGITVSSGGASITGNTSVTGTLGATGAFSLGSSSLNGIGDFHGQGGVGAYVRFVDDANSVTRGYTGYGSTLFSANLSDFGIRSQGNLLLSSYGTVAATFDNNQNLGLGVTPSAWSGSSRAIDIASFGAGLVSSPGGNTDTNLTHNAYHNGTNWIYKATSVSAGRYQIDGHNGGSSHSWHVSAGGTAGNPISFTQAMTLDGSGNLLVGTTSQPAGVGSSRLGVVSSASDYTIAANNSNASPYGFYLRYTGAAPNGNSNQFFYFQDTGGARAYMQSNGGLANYSANDSNLSDIRTKKDFVPAKSYYERWTDIEFVTFLYKDQTDTERNLGVTAQQLESVFPELIDNSGFGETPEDGIPLKAVYQTDFQYATARALQEAIEQIEILKAKVAALEARA